MVSLLPRQKPTRHAGPYVAPVSAFGRDDGHRAGGKGANLGELVRAGLPVPPGFVTTTAAYDLHLERNGLVERIPALLAAGETDGSTIRGALVTAGMPPEVADAVRAAYRALGEGAVAVRSSATAEDLPEAAFAGQQDTYLNVVGEAALLEAVRRCWASLWTERAIAYRQRQQLDHLAARMAVVVQHMVPAETAGVLFTANPVTGARDEVVIDASAGLGEAVVSGLVTPDHYVLRKRLPRLKEWQPGRREVIIRARHGGGVEHLSMPADSGNAERSLTDRALRRLVRLGVAIERHFGGPQDIEWAWAGGKALILQARPITALPSPPPSPSRAQRRMAGLIAELFPVRPYPLDVTTWSGALFGAAIAMAKFVGIMLPSFERLFFEQDGVVVRFNPPAPRPTARILLAPARLMRHAWRYDPAAWWTDPLLTEAHRRVHALEARDLGSLSWQELLATLRDALAIPALIIELRIRYFPGAALAYFRLRLVLGLLRRGRRLSALLLGFENKTTETNRALETLATTIRSERALAEVFASHTPDELMAALEAQPSFRPFLDELGAFLDRYGHRETATPLLATQPTWKEAPDVVLSMLQGLAAAPPRAVTGPPAAEVARGELLGHPLLRLRPLRSALLRLLEQARLFTQIREDTHFYNTLPLPTVRRTMLESGRRLAAVGVLDAPAEVFHLRLDELEQVGEAWPPSPPLALHLRTLAHQRQARRAALVDTPLLDQRLLTVARAGGDVLVRGTPGSPGVAEGPARVIRDVSEFSRLKAGDVLVAPSTNPAWTPLFQRVAAVVVDSGGAGSHAAIVAREYGIPAVMATGDGTRQLTDGQSIRVDGNQGLVTPGQPESPVPPSEE
jgi:phosphohistidine swiveling domain-containing protein